MSATDLDTEATARADALAHDPWHFPDHASVQIVCGALDSAERGMFASEQDHNYMAMCAYADQDALIELVRHVSAANPGTRVDHTLPARLTDSDLQSHVVVLGNMAWRQLGETFEQTGVPVRPIDSEGLDGEIFETADGQRFLPTFVRDDSGGAVIEDVGFFWRGPSPFNSARTLTICSGVFTRGVFGTVRALTDRGMRHDNAGYLRQRFADGAAYGLLMRVPVLGHVTATPYLCDERFRLREFPSS